MGEGLAAARNDALGDRNLPRKPCVGAPATARHGGVC